MAQHKWYTFKDFVTGKIKRTRGKFAGWVTDGMDIRRAVFELPSGEHYVPEYCLTPETKKALESLSGGPCKSCGHDEHYHLNGVCGLEKCGCRRYIGEESEALERAAGA